MQLNLVKNVSTQGVRLVVSFCLTLLLCYYLPSSLNHTESLSEITLQSQPFQPLSVLQRQIDEPKGEKVISTKSVVETMTAPKVSLTPFVASQAQWTIALPMLSMPSLKSMVLPSLGPLLLGISEVTQPPELLHYIQPKMPIAARNYKQGGKLMLRLVVEVSGQVSEAVVLSAEPEGIFNQASITAAKKWRFKPAHLDGEAVRVFVDVPINFKVN